MAKPKATLDAKKTVKRSAAPLDLVTSTGLKGLVVERIEPRQTLAAGVAHSLQIARMAQFRYDSVEVFPQGDGWSVGKFVHIRDLCKTYAISRATLQGGATRYSFPDGTAVVVFLSNWKTARYSVAEVLKDPRKAMATA